MKKCCLIFLCLTFSLVFSQQRKIDSLNLLLSQPQHDTVKFKRLVKLLYVYKKMNLNKAIEVSDRVVALAEHLDERHKADAYYYKGMLRMHQGEGKEALELSLKSIEIYKKLGRKKDLAQTYNQVANIYLFKLDRNSAIRYYLLSLSLKEEIGDLEGASNTLGNMGLVYMDMGNFQKAIEYYKRSAEIKKQIGDMAGYASCLVNIPNAFNRMNNYGESIKVLNVALRIADSLDNPYLQGAALGNLAEAYLFNGDHKTAEKYISACLTKREQLADSNDLCFTYITMGSICQAQGKFRRAIECGRKAEAIAKNHEWKDREYDIYGLLGTAYYESGDYKAAADYLFKLKDIGDTIYNQQSVKNIAEIEAKYLDEKKDTELRLNAEKVKNQQLEIKRQNSQKIIFGVALLLSLGVIALVFRSYRQKRKANLIISEQKTRVEEQAKLLEVKNKEITDSIYYARRIQQTLLPSARYFEKYLKRKSE